MGQAKQRKQLLGAAYGQPVADQYVQPVAWARGIDGIHVTTPIQMGDCSLRVAMTYQLLQQQGKADGLVIQAGSLMACDVEIGQWDSWHVMGHAWIRDTRTDTLIDVSTDTWPDQLRQMQFRLNDDALTASQQGVGTPDLPAVIHRVKGSRIQGCSLVYLPGVDGLECIEAHQGAHPESLQQRRTLFRFIGEKWQAWARATRHRGDCTAEVMNDIAPLMALTA